MTAQSSSKSVFGAYLKYRLGVMKLNFVMCCILNVLALPLYAVAANVGFGGIVSEFAAFGRVFSIMCISALPAIAIFNAVTSFDYYHKKDMTDTIGVLPLTHRERFFADLLAGYVTNVAPLILCGIFCTVIFGTMQNKFMEFAHIEVGACDFRMVSLGIVIAVTLFLIVSFAYLFTVLISVCCGKVFHSVIFPVVGMAVLPLLFGGLARCFANGVVGIDSSVYFTKAAAFFPPIGLIGELFDALGFSFNSYMIVASLPRAGELYAVGKPIYIAVYVLLAAGLVALAYFISKRRLAENTGSAFAIKPMSAVLSAGIAAAVTITMLAVTYHSITFYHLVSAAAGIVTYFVTLLLYPQKKKERLRSIVLGAGTVTVMLGVWVLLDKTGSFGVRYFPGDPDKIEYVKINNTYTITDKADIEKYTSLLNESLRAKPSDMDFENGYDRGFRVEIKTADGKTVERLYSNNSYGMRLFGKLDGYVDYFFDELESFSDEWSCHLEANDTATMWIPEDKTKELIAILREEASEKHRPDANKFVDIVFTCHFGGVRTFEIEEDFSRTIRFLETMEDTVERDPESTYLSIEYNVYGDEWVWFSVYIPFKDRDNEKVKELVALLEECEGEDRAPNFKVKSYYITGEQDVTVKNRDRVLELMAEIAADLIDNEQTTDS